MNANEAGTVRTELPGAALDDPFTARVPRRFARLLLEASKRATLRAATGRTATNGIADRAFEVHG
jgi:hypothetical protein